jgi:uncharacterized protein
MQEVGFFFPGRRHSLFGVFHQPEGTARRTPFVFCHPFGEEKLWAHRTYVSFARALAAAGHPVLRFDFMGNGDSGGEFPESSLETAMEDVLSAIDEMQRRTGQKAVSLLGLRFGATVASLVAERVPDLDRLILWAPVIDGARYMQEVLRMNVSTQMTIYKEVRRDREQLVQEMRDGKTVNVDGYEMAWPMYEQVSAIKLAAGTKRCAAPCLIAQIDRQAVKAVAEFEQLAATYSSAQLLLVQEDAFWKEIARFYDSAPNLFPATLGWLDQAGAATPAQ